MATGSNTLMRMQALAGDRGGVLTLTTSTTYQIRRDVDGVVIVGPGASLATTEAYCAVVDPSITGQA